MATVPVAPVFGSIKPSQKQQLLETNYLSFTDGNNDFAQQYLPEIYEQEVERYGNRTLSGFLRMVGAEMPMTSDQIVWSEQNRLHIAYDGCTHSAGVADDITFPVGGAGATFVENVISVNQTIVIMNPANGAEVKALVVGSVTAAGVASISVKSYTAANVAPTIPQGTANLKIFVYGSEYRKGTTDNDIKSVTPSFTQFQNSPIIIKEKYAINGSDTAQIGWVEVATEDGTSGFL